MLHKLLGFAEATAPAPSRRARLHGGTACAALAMAAAFWATPAQIHPAWAQTPSAGLPAAAEPFNIAAEGLADGLTQLGQQLGLQVSAPSALLQGRSTGGVHGSMPAAKALDTLLSGTGLGWQIQNGIITLHPDDGAQLTLPSVNVNAGMQAQSYVATNASTGTKTDTPLLETPQSISVVTQKQLRDQGATTIAQSLAYTAGVQTQPYGYDSRYDQLMLRGFFINQYGNYVDGLRQGNGSFAYFRNEPYGLDRIEVLRGPTSVLYGSNNPGGLINLVSKMPTEQTFGEAKVTGGSYGLIQAQLDAGGALDKDDKYLYRLTMLGRDSGTQVPKARDNRFYVAPAFTVKLDDNTKLTLLTEYERNHTAMWPYYLYVPGKGLTHIRLTDNNFDALRQEQWSVGTVFEHRFDNVWTVRQKFRYGQVAFDGRFVDENSLTGNTLARYAAEVREHLNVLNLDNEAEAHFTTGAVRHTFLSGVDFFHQEYTSTIAMGTAPSLNIANPIYSTSPVGSLTQISNTYQNLSQLGLYMQDQMAWQRWRLTLAGREDFAWQESTNRATEVTTNANPSHLTGKVGLLYLFDNGIAPYASYSTSFLPQSGTLAPQRGATPYKPTTGEQWEAGVKYQPHGFRSFITASLYQITQENVLTTDPLYTAYSVQTGEVRSRGGEVEATLALARGLNGIASFSYTDAQVTKSNGTDLNKVPVAVPKTQAALFLDYTQADGHFAGLGGAAGVRYIGSTWADTANTQKNNAITSFDLALHQDINRFRLQLNVNNIADKRVAVCVSGNCTWSLGRVILGSISVRW